MTRSDWGALSLRAVLTAGWQSNAGESSAAPGAADDLGGHTPPTAVGTQPARQFKIDVDKAIVVKLPEATQVPTPAAISTEDGSTAAVVENGCVAFNIDSFTVKGNDSACR